MKGIVTSPGYPGKYPRCFLDRLAVIEAPKGSKIFLRIYKLDIQDRFGDELLIAEGVRSKREYLNNVFFQTCAFYNSNGELGYKATFEEQVEKRMNTKIS